MTDLVKLGGWWLTAHGLLMVDVLWLAWFWVLLWLRMAVKYDMSLFSKKKGGSWGLETRLVTGARIYTSASDASHPFLGWDPSLFKKHQWSQKRLRCSVMRRCESQECDSTQLGGGFKFFFIFTTASVVVYWKIFASNDATVLWLKKLRVFQKSSFGVSENVSLDTKVQRHTYNIYIYILLYIFIYDIFRYIINDISL